MALLSADHLALCVVQVARVAVPTIATDNSRPATVTALRDLIVGPLAGTPPLLDEMIPGGRPTLILVPEYALGSPDWVSIDGFVRASQRPLVVIAGFGMTPGAWITAWATGAPAPSPTVRILGWNQAAHPIAQGRPANGGWCWIHDPGNGTTCITFLKNFLEQTEEAAHVPLLQTGTTIVRLRFDDFELFPVLCADLLQPPELNGSAAHRIRHALQAEVAPRRVLVAGCLRETAPENVNWQNAITAIVNHMAAGHSVLVALANQAHGTPREAEGVDRWRSLSGTYGRHTDFPRGQDPLPGGRPITEGALSGVVVRDCGPCTVAGVIAWSPYHPITGRYIWRTELCQALAATGVVRFAPHETIAGYEFHRFTRRHPGHAGWSPRVADGLERIRAHIATDSPPKAERIVDQLLHGVVSESSAPNPDHLHTVTPALVLGTHALAVLATLDTAAWQSNDGLEGQLTLANEINLLVWIDPRRTGRGIVRELQNWAKQPGTHPPLVVVGQGNPTAVPEGRVQVDRRSDISAAPAGVAVFQDEVATTRDISSSQALRTVGCISLDRIAEYYAEYHPDDDQAHLVAMLERIHECLRAA